MAIVKNTGVIVTDSDPNLITEIATTTEAPIAYDSTTETHYKFDSTLTVGNRWVAQQVASAENGLRVSGGKAVLGSDSSTDAKGSVLLDDSYIHMDGWRQFYMSTGAATKSFIISQSQGIGCNINSLTSYSGVANKTVFRVDTNKNPPTFISQFVTDGSTLPYSDYAVVLGGADNSADGTTLATIIGATTSTINAGAHNSHIYGGTTNVISSFANQNLIFGGQINTISGSTSSIINSNNSSIAGGTKNTIIGSTTSTINSTVQNIIFGGTTNTISGTSSNSTIINGVSQTVSAIYSSIFGGTLNAVSGTYATIVGGLSNSISGSGAGIFSSQSCTASGTTNFVVGALSSGSSVGSQCGIIGGSTNTVSASHSVVIGGNTNSVTQQQAVLLGGSNNTNSGRKSVIVGGEYNLSNSFSQTILGYGNVRATGQNAIAIAPTDVLFVVGNGVGATSNFSNSFTMLKNGKSQFNDTFVATALTEAQVTPNAALEVVSTTSGFLAPRLTEAEVNTLLATLNLTTDITGGANGNAYSKKGMEVECTDCVPLDGSTEGVTLKLYPNAALTAWVAKKLW